MEFDKNKTKYFVIAIILLIILGVILIVHFNNKSMVSGDKEDTTKKTTEKVTKDETTKVTTKKVEVNEISVNKDIYKSVVDDENKLLYNYKLTDEISDTDIIISKVLDLNEEYKNNNIISLYDISLYNSNMVKKSVKNSLITISIPITGNLVGYDDYKVVYIDDNNNITNEEFNTTVSDGYITFDTTHLSIYGVIGFNNGKKETKEVDLDDVNVKIAFNDELVNNNDTIYTTTNDTVGVTVSGVDNYIVYYGLQDKDNNMEYKEYTTSGIFKDIVTYSELKLFVKVVIGSQEKTFELNTFKVYDFIYLYDRNNPEGPEYTSEETLNYLLKDVTEENETEQLNVNPETDVTIYVNGNTYLVEKADISELGMTGTLYIDTKDRIDIGTTESELIDSKGLDKIVIMSEYFNLNGVDYKYSSDKEGNITITKVETNEEVSAVFEVSFDTNVDIYPDEDENLVIEFIRETSEVDVEQNPETETNESEQEVNETIENESQEQNNQG